MAVAARHRADPEHGRASLEPNELRARRQALGLSQQALGRALGVSGNTLARWERGTQCLANPRLVRLALERIELRAASDQSAPAQHRPGRRHNLPPALTSFVGRRRELRVLRRLVLSTRLVTVTGAAGIGKTRLAVEAASGLLRHFPDGVWLIELASVDEPALVPNALAAALRVPEEPGQPTLQSIVASLADRRLLLVLDNCEHLVAACAELVAELVRGCLTLHVLTTSREPLGVAGELTWRVPPLSLPAYGQPVDVQRLLRSESAALFVARARAAAPGFTLSPGTSEPVAEICRRLDGLPLALELAAARLRAVGLAELASRLDDRFRLLVGGPRGGPAHHVTLHTTIDWSYTLIPEAERHLFERLAVFAGSWTLPAAEAVCAGGAVQADGVLELLSRLVDRSLVVAEPTGDGTLRYRLLETLRAYAAQALGAQDRLEVERRHADFYLDLAESAEPRLVRSDQVEWAARLDQELPNLRAALGWCLSAPGSDAAAGLRLAAALAHFWQLGPHLREGRSWLQRLLTAAASDVPERAGALWADGLLAWQVGDLLGAATAYEQGLASVRQSSATRHLALLQIGLGTVLGLARGDVAAGRSLVEEGLATARERGEQWAIGHALFWLGNMAHVQGEYARARRLLEESEAPARELGDRRDLAYALLTRGYLALTMRDDRAAHDVFHEALGMTHAVGDPLGTIWALEGLTAVLSARGQADRAARLMGAVEVQRAALRLSRDPMPGWREVGEQVRASLRRALGQRAFDAAIAQGRRLAPDRAVSEALGQSVSGGPKNPGGGLSRREWEVAQLVARGLTNRQVAHELVIAEGTAQRHVANILEELSLASRAELATWVATNAHGLAVT